MKTKLLILLLLIVSISSNADIITRKAEYLKLLNNKEAPTVIPVDLDIVINTTLGQFIIYSKVTQVFDIVEEIDDLYKDGYHLVVYKAKDFYGKIAIIQVWMSDVKPDVIRIFYSGLNYEYKLKEN